MPSPDSRDSLTSRRCFPTIRASCEFPGSSVVERRTVNPLVGGSNPSRGAKGQKGPAKPTAFHSSSLPIRTADRQQDGSTTPRSGGDRPQGDPKGEARSAE